MYVSLMDTLNDNLGWPHCESHVALAEEGGSYNKIWLQHFNASLGTNSKYLDLRIALRRK
jgi:hypothetical protein